MIVYSSIYGGHDAPKPPRPHPAVTEWILYTDDPTIYAPGWRVVVEPRPEHEHPRMSAKWRKCRPPTTERFALYLDGSVRLRDPELISHALDLLERGASWAMYPHPDRQTIRSEVDACRGMPKYSGLIDRMIEQVEHYIDLGAESLPLWACGIIARDVSRTDVLAAGAQWFRECDRFTYQDQISLPVVLAQHHVTPTAMTIGGGLWGNSHFSVEGHRSDW